MRTVVLCLALMCAAGAVVNNPTAYAADSTPVTIPQKPVKNAAAVTLGRLGGLKGGKARAQKLTQEQRVEIAKNAAKARWKQ